VHETGTTIAVIDEILNRRSLMPSPLLRDLSEKHELVAVDETSIDAFLSAAPGEAEHVILFFAGDPAQRGETHDVAIILPQLLEAFAGRLRAAIVATRAEAALQRRFHVGVFPSLVVTRAGETLGVLPKVHDWPDYIARIEAMLRPGAPALVAASGPRVEVVYSKREAAK
jgi:hydrogenase-1 operon protein HyaE